MCEKYDVIVIKKRLFKGDIKLKGKILDDEIDTYEDWLNSEYEERCTTIKLENDKIIKIRNYGNLFNLYSFERIN